MTAHELPIGGHRVATFITERPYSRHDTHSIVDCSLFRSRDAWSLLAIAMDERHDPDTGEPTEDCEAVALLYRCDDLGELRRLVADRFASDTWRTLLDAGHEHDRDLWRAWVPTRIERDFENASITNRDLAHSEGYLQPRTPAVGRHLPGWERDAVDAMATTLTDRHYTVAASRLYEHDDRPDGFGNQALGELDVQRYGHAATGIVRVDDAGEIFIRLPYGDNVDDDSDFTGLVHPVPDDDGDFDANRGW